MIYNAGVKTTFSAPRTRKVVMGLKQINNFLNWLIRDRKMFVDKWEPMQIVTHHIKSDYRPGINRVI